MSQTGMTEIVHQGRKITKFELIKFAIELIVAACVFVGLYFNYSALEQNTSTNKVACRTQLFEAETKLTAIERAQGNADLSSLFMVIGPDVSPEQYCAAYLSVLTSDSQVTGITTAQQLFNALWSQEAFRDGNLEKRSRLRNVYLQAEDYFYHLHNAYDFMEDGIIERSEWLTWKGIFDDMGTHPIFLAVVRTGWQRRYFTYEFGEELLDSLLPEIPGKSTLDSARLERNRRFISTYFPEMLDKPKFLSQLPRSGDLLYRQGKEADAPPSLAARQ